ncbi:hypothetical protein [uncultured Bifidobacterium sp.]|uniref:hypothetical protein n=1 Tax=uncultured Bifidobacterium sp. TaxID=165187 RepID=UPI0028DC76D0|nr:hypothetical protein [uncultured Bifidobacterium sp.]
MPNRHPRTVLRRRIVRVLVAAGTLVVLAAGCGAPTGTSSSATSSAGSSASGSVAVFTPADSLVRGSDAPLGTWSLLRAELKKSLVSVGFDSDSITTTTSRTSEAQAKAVRDFVVKAAARSTSSGAATSTTLVVAPVPEDATDDDSYGDLLTRTAADEDADTPALTNALSLARRSGMHVVLVSNALDGFSPDLLVQPSRARQIGRTQALKLVDKIELGKATASDPRIIEVLIPATDDSTDAEAFAGVWDVLGPYFRKGVAVSTSGTLSAATTEDDWGSVVYDAGSSTSSMTKNSAKELASRLDDGSGSRTRIDGVIAMTDAAASGVVDELTTLGYTGSSADVNPSISISGIVEGITGRHDVVRSPVPEPTGGDTTGNATDSRWPIVTSFGASTGMLPQIVDGRLWMTSLEDIATTTTQTAEACARLDAGKTANGLKSITMTTVKGRRIAVLRPKLLTVSASNLKKTLIDPGYVSLADAGL